MEDDSRQRGAGSARRGAEEKLEEWIKGRIARKIDDLFASSEDDQLRAAIESEVWRLFGEEIRREAISKSHDSARPAVYSAIYGQQDISWLASCTFLRDHCGIEGMDAMSGMIRVAKSAGWWWPYDELAIITERPALLRNDAQGRLHCADGPALQYPDGFGVWSWHGTQVPSDLIEEGWSVERIFLEPNAEIRRCAIERMGWDVFIQMADLELIASLPDPGNAPHDIALYELPEGLRNIYAEPARILLCVNGTPEPDGTFRRFGLPVPAHHADPLAAAADLYGLTADEYRRAEVRR